MEPLAWIGCVAICGSIACLRGPWSMVLVAGGKFTDQLTSKDVWTGALLLAIAVELFVNGVFSSWYITHRRFYTILNWGLEHSGMTEIELRTWVWQVKWLWPFVLMMVLVLDAGVLFAQTFHLCILWLWTNWVVHKSAQHWLKHRVTPERILTADVGEELLQLLRGMKNVSETWAVNHAVRFVTRYYHYPWAPWIFAAAIACWFCAQCCLFFVCC